MEDMWHRIVLHEGEEFRQKRGKAFMYKMNANVNVSNTMTISITKGEVEKAWNRMAVNGPDRNSVQIGYITHLSLLLCKKMFIM
ncbi:hypothetical protein J2T13_002361 [Paenibacillus sp. DS2015]|uniref:hypothetical protein n=1 Tax=Paenibacillus sp. DS2015 TaxID=3373917 RepID=UPI003D198138